MIRLKINKELTNFTVIDDSESTPGKSRLMCMFRQKVVPQVSRFVSRGRKDYLSSELELIAGDLMQERFHVGSIEFAVTSVEQEDGGIMVEFVACIEDSAASETGNWTDGFWEYVAAFVAGCAVGVLLFFI